MTPGSLLSHLECGRCGASHDAFAPAHLCSCGGPLLARYDLAGLDRSDWRRRVAAAPRGLWRYAELLPVFGADRRISLGEGSTPLMRARISPGSGPGSREVWFKWEGDNPTGSFKARGMAVAVSRAVELGARRFVVPTAGNAGVAASAYVQAAGGELDVFMPEDTDPAFFAAARDYGARVHAVAGLISDCGRAALPLIEAGAYDLSTLKEPYRLEGKKTMGYELWEDTGGRLPDVIVYPTGGGTGLVGMWKAFAELGELGFVAASSRPRMVSVQMEGCAPIVRAFRSRAERAEPWANAHTDVLGLRVPGAVGDSLILRALYESNGTAVTVTEADAVRATEELCTRHGLSAAPEDGAALAATAELCASGWILPTERVVVFLTGSGRLYRQILLRHGVVLPA